MRVNLVFTPFALPHNPPLGIAHLKSSLAQHVQDCKVKCIDLNLFFHHEYFEGCRNSSLNDAASTTKALVSRSAEIFRGVSRPDLFFDSAHFNELAQVFFNNLMAVYTHCSHACKMYMEDKGRDPFIELLAGYAAELLRNIPDVIGFSVMMVEQLYCSLALARLVKEMDRRVKVVFGGSLISREVGKLIAPLGEVDYIIQGEGERPLAELLGSPASPSVFPGLLYEKDGQVLDYGFDYIHDLASAPWADFSDFPLEAYYSPEICIPLLSSRGCYWQKCAFCVHYYNFRNCYRVRPVADVIKELAFHVDNGIKYFSFVDEMIPANRFSQISEAILKTSLEISYYALAKPKKTFTMDVLRSMAASGCKAIFWGVESANQRVLDLMNKGTFVHEMGKVLQMSHRAGIKNHVFIILGFPSETLKECQETLRFLYDNQECIDAVHNSRFFLNKGSFVFENPAKFGIIEICDSQLWKDWYRYEVSEGLSQDEIAALSENLSDYFSSFSAYSPFLRSFRDHAMIIYSKFGQDYNRFTETRTIRYPVLDELRLKRGSNLV